MLGDLIWQPYKISSGSVPDPYKSGIFNGKGAQLAVDRCSLTVPDAMHALCFSLLESSGSSSDDVYYLELDSTVLSLTTESTVSKRPSIALYFKHVMNLSVLQTISRLGIF